jgi:hypothetical protein
VSRPRKKPTITDQILYLIAQAVEEKRYKLAKQLTDLLEEMDTPNTKEAKAIERVWLSAFEPKEEK